MINGMSDLLKRVTDFYLQSGDFNGYSFHKEGEEERAEAVRLTSEGLLQVVGEEDYLNPHIRPWPSRRSIDDQVASINELPDAEYGVCLYPTPKALKSRRLPKRLADQPYSRAMGKGRGTLELAYFRFDVLEGYRNDPRFTFRFHDFGAYVVVSDEAYLDEGEPESDRIIMNHIGFAYDLSRYDPNDDESPIVRLVCASYGDLAKLNQTHQTRWKTYQIEPDDHLHPHPAWWGQQMGRWPDGLGPFERIFAELRAINILHERAFGQPLFRSNERPNDFGWILRPSQQEFDRFVHEFDKLLSENLLHDAFDLHCIPRKDDQGNNIGSLNRLDRLLQMHQIPDDIRKELLGPLREIRSARQKPAHALRRNITDKSFVRKQADLLARVGQTLGELRYFFQSHPTNADWEEPESMGGKQYRL
jgi:hypothetical protein